MITIDPRISAIASGIAAAIPEVQVGLFESRARGTAQPDVESLRKGPQKLGIHSRGGLAPFSHDFVALMDWLEESGADVSPFERIADLPFSAVQSRYDDSLKIISPWLLGLASQGGKPCVGGAEAPAAHRDDLGTMNG